MLAMMERLTLRRKYVVTLLILLSLLAVAVLALTSSVAAVDEWTDNESSGTARTLDTPASIGPVHIWKRDGDVNLDWFKFTAAEGQHVEVKFRKYTQDPRITELQGYTYYIKYDIWGPYVPGRNVYSYEATYPNQGGPREWHMRDTFSMLVPKNLGGTYFIRVYVDPPNNDPYRDHAYYWLNVTVSNVPSLDSNPTGSGRLSQYDDYNVDFNFEDYYSITLEANKAAGEMATVTVTKLAGTDGWIFVEAWSKIPFGQGQNDHMLNRTYMGDGTPVRVEFAAPSSGVYYIRVYRYFSSHGQTDYTIGVYTTSDPSDGDDVASLGTPVLQSTTFTQRSIMMAYDTHDWYQCMILDGDKRFHVTLTLNDPAINDGHGVEMVVYNGDGLVMWSVNNIYRVGDTTAWRMLLELPPAGTTTIFDRDETYYVRVSVDPEITSSNVAGWYTTYTIEFELANRAPVLEVPFEPLYQWNEDGKLSIELDSHFSDMEGDPMEYTVLNKTTGFTVDNIALSDEGHLNITSPPDWNGEVWWRLRAVDSGGGESHFIYIDLKLRVNPVPDRPRARDPISVACDEEATATVDLSDLFYDVDQGPGGILTFGWTDEGMEDVDVSVNDMTGEMILAPALDVFGEFTIIVWCYDDVPEHVTGEVILTVRPVNDVPRIAQVIPDLELDEGDTNSHEVNMASYFIDVDGDALTYTFTVPASVKNDVNVIHKNNVLTSSILVLTVQDPYFYATFDVNITAKDPAETLVYQNMRVVIDPMPNAPEILVTPVGNPSAIDETGSVAFEVTDILDQDLPEAGLHTYTWYLDQNILSVNTSKYTYHADYDSAGTHSVKVVVTDPSGLSDEASWMFSVTNVNRKPTATITTIPTALSEDEKIILSVDAIDPDGGDLTITWYLVTDTEDKVLGVGPTLETKLPPGTQTIEVEVLDSGGAKAVDSFTIKVSPVEEETIFNFTMLLSVILLVAAVVSVVGFMMTRKGKPHVPSEAHMDLETLQKGYDPSPGGTSDYGEEYNPVPKDQDGYNKLE